MMQWLRILAEEQRRKSRVREMQMIQMKLCSIPPNVAGAPKKTQVNLGERHPPPPPHAPKSMEEDEEEENQTEAIY